MERMTFDDFVKKMRTLELFRHSHLLTMDTIENNGKDYNLLMSLHKEMMSKINDESFMLKEYTKYCNS